LLGEGTDRNTQPAKGTLTGQGGSDVTVQTSLRGIAKKSLIAEASISEEPGAGKPHAGICAGAAE